MKKQSRVMPTAMLAAVCAMIFLTSCTTQDQKEATNDYQQSADQSAQENTNDLKEKELQEAAEKSAEEDEQMESYNKTMKKAIKAIKKDDAKALDKLQDSKEGRALSKMVGNGGSYLYLPKGGDSGKGIGFYNFKDCDCYQWYYGDYKDGKRDGSGIWYYTSSHTEDGKLYKEVYNGEWKNDVPNGEGHQVIVLDDQVDTDQKFKVKKGLFYGTYKIEETLEDGTVVTGKYKLKKGKYVTISDEELTENNFVIPDQPHLAIAFLYDENEVVKSCKMVYAVDVTKGVKHFYSSK